MKTFRFRGKDRIVGIKPVTPEAHAAHAAKGMFHELVKVAPTTPPPPAKTSYSQAAQAALATMLKNDELGCCAEACDLHLDAQRCANAGAPYVPTDDQVTTEYSAITGYDPKDPSTDQGTDVTQLIAYRASHAYPSGATLLGAPPVDASSQARVEQALYLTEGLSGCLCLPDDYESEEDAGDTWDVAGPANFENGHNVSIVDYDSVQKKVLLCTWGELIWMTFAAVAKYMVPTAGGAIYAYCSSDCISAMTKKAANGYDFSTLATYLGLKAPTLPAPAPAPAPDPDETAPGIVPFVDPNPDEPIEDL